VVTTLNCASESGEKGSEMDQTRRPRSKWRLRKLFREGGGTQLHKSTSFHSKTSSDMTASSTPVLQPTSAHPLSRINAVELGESGPPAAGTVASLHNHHHHQKLDFDQAHSSMSTSNATSSSQVSSSKQKCTIS
jgi:hypothetical protein